MEIDTVLTSGFPSLLVPAFSLTKNQKKKKRQKLSKIHKNQAVKVEQKAQLLQQGQLGETTGGIGGVEDAVLQCPSLHTKVLAGTGASHPPSPHDLSQSVPKLSVETLQASDRRACTAGPTQRCQRAAGSPPSSPSSSQLQGLEFEGQMQRRVDFSHAATLIHSQLSWPTHLLAPALPPSSYSPATSGCVSLVCEGAALPCTTRPLPPFGAFKSVVTLHQSGERLLAVASSTVTSTLTPPAAGAAQRGTNLEVGEAVQQQLSGSKRKRQQGHLVWNSDAEEDGGPVQACRPGRQVGEGGECGGSEQQASEDWGEAKGEGEVSNSVGQGAGLAHQQQQQQRERGEGHPKQRRVSVHGNYHRYYGYRLGQAFGDDPRLQCFERQWFANRRCLDVGCNEGVVTLALATKYGAKSMMGVDIDEHLIRKACMTLRVERSRAAVRAVEVRRGGTSPAERRAAHVAHAALAQTWFVHADFVGSQGEEGSFETITCLSVAKWVHLNQGDAGLEALLSKCWRLLSPGGYFLLEPQPWKSYKAAAAKMRKQPLSPSTYFQRLEELSIRPEALPSLLVDGLGFRLIKRLHPPSTAAAGFDRPMYLFRKPS